MDNNASNEIDDFNKIILEQKKIIYPNNNENDNIFISYLLYSLINHYGYEIIFNIIMKRIKNKVNNNSSDYIENLISIIGFSNLIIFI